MTEPTSASIVISSVKSSLKELLIKVCGAEHRTKLLSTLLKLKLLTRDVKNFSRKQLMQERRNQEVWGETISSWETEDAQEVVK